MPWMQSVQLQMLQQLPSGDPWSSGMQLTKPQRWGMQMLLSNSSYRGRESSLNKNSPARL